MALSITRNYDDGTELTEQQLDDAFDSIETYFNVTGISEAEIQDNTITAAELQTSSVTEAKIASNAVVTSKILDANITRAKLAAALQAYLVPTGAVSAYINASAPTGWLVCDGTAVNRTTYADLFAIIGTSHGTGDGSTTFHLPDYRGRFLRGVDGGTGNDPDAASRVVMNTGGNATGVGSLQDSENKAHTHGLPAGNAGAGLVAASFGFDSSGFLATSQSTGGGESRPKNAAVYFIIKT